MKQSCEKFEKSEKLKNLEKFWQIHKRNFENFFINIV